MQTAAFTALSASIHKLIAMFSTDGVSRVAHGQLKPEPVFLMSFDDKIVRDYASSGQEAPGESGPKHI